MLVRTTNFSINLPYRSRALIGEQALRGVNTTKPSQLGARDVQVANEMFTKVSCPASNRRDINIEYFSGYSFRTRPT